MKEIFVEIITMIFYLFFNGNSTKNWVYLKNESSLNIDEVESTQEFLLYVT